ncbi:MAG: chromosomal replication initiator protein DnaA, partial [Firmicutes bacterium]|nr:chromosomal replication initiator protein DnaA [Bacillota bacterium]
MTNSELKKNWKKVLDNSPSDKINKVKIDQWYKPLVPVRIDEEAGVIYFVSDDSSPVLRNMINTNYGIIKEPLSSVFGKEYRLELVEDEGKPEYVDEFGEEYVDSRYTFDSFVSGPNNRLALACSLAIAERFTPDYNPLFIYGGSGLGKTHLLAAISHYVKEKNPEKKVLYVTTEAFTNELVKSIRENSTAAFHDKYRKVDILLLDDIQFIADKERTQEEVFNTFNALHAANKQVVLSSDKPPKDLKNLPERLISRFSQGMIADIQPPDYETRMAILQQKVEEKGLAIDKNMADVIDLIAQNITDNIRDLEGALTRVITMASFGKTELTKEFARSVLSDIF